MEDPVFESDKRWRIFRSPKLLRCPPKFLIHVFRELFT